MTALMKFAVSGPAVAAYRQHGPAMTDQVNRRVAGSPRIHDLIGGNPLEMLYANHRHHHLFMAGVMELNAWPLLQRTVPWVYRAYCSHGFSPAYFLEEFAAWIEALETCLEPAHAAEILPVYRGFEAAHEGFIGASRRDYEHPTVFAGPWASRSEELIALLISGDSSGVIRLAEGEVGDPQGLQQFYLGALAPALMEIGARWEDGRISVAHEHLASGVVNRVMAYWYHHVLAEKKGRGKAVVTSGPGEFHAIGGAMLADSLSIDGWETVHLGANTPATDLLVLLDSYQPDLLAVSVCMPFNITDARDMIQAARQLDTLDHCRIMVGGQAFGPMPELWQETGADLHPPTVEVAVDLARGFGRP